MTVIAPTMEELEAERQRLVALIAATRLELANVKAAMRLLGADVRYNRPPAEKAGAA